MNNYQLVEVYHDNNVFYEKSIYITCGSVCYFIK